jgi:anti-anti-sigma factor
MADVEFYKNSLFTHGMEGARAFLASQGFAVHEETVDAWLPDLPNIDADLMGRLRQAYRQMQILTMTAEAKKSQAERRNLPFAVDASFGNGKFSAVIQGRMDTITAPELLKKFQEMPEKADAIEVDVKDMADVSSAGLRVLLMMYKSLKDKSQFKLLNVSDEVKEILETTGFDQFLL